MFHTNTVDAAEDLAIDLAQLVIARDERCSTQQLEQYCRSAMLSTCAALQAYPNLLALGASRLLMRVQTARATLAHEQVEIANELLERMRSPRSARPAPPVYYSPVPAFPELHNQGQEQAAGPVLLRRSPHSGYVADVGSVHQAPAAPVPAPGSVGILFSLPWTIESTAQACTAMQARPLPPAPSSVVCCLGSISHAKRYHHFRCHLLLASPGLFKQSVSLQLVIPLQLRGMDCCRNCRRHFR